MGFQSERLLQPFVFCLCQVAVESETPAVPATVVLHVSEQSMLQQRVPSRIQMLQFHTIPGFPSCLACGLRVCIAKISLVRHISIGCRRMCCLCGFESELRPGKVSLRTRWNLLSIRRLEAQNPNNSFTRNRQIIQQAGSDLNTRKMSSEGAATHIMPHGLLHPALYPTSSR